MWSSGIVLVAIVLTATAVPGYDSFPRKEASWREMLAGLMATTPPGTGMCSDRCLVIIGGVERLLDVDKTYADPENPCILHICKENGLDQQLTKCTPVEEIDPCSDGNPPFRLPGQCCASCGPRVPRGPEDEDEFSDWGEWTECSRTCGGGARSRRRVCKITETGLAVDCQGKTLDVQDCNTHLCAVHCKWEWSKFGACSVTCGEGVRTRFPIITQEPERGGQDCPPSVRRRDPDTIQCVEEECGCPDGENFCDGVCLPDIDGDCVANNKDNCKLKSNRDQKDTDGDGIGDYCDNCVFADNPLQENSDGDTSGNACDEDDDNDKVVDGLDNCPLVYNPHQSSKDPARYGSKCTTPSRSSAMRMDYDDISPVGSDKKGLAAEIMEKLLEMYYSN